MSLAGFASPATNENSSDDIDTDHIKSMPSLSIEQLQLQVAQELSERDEIEIDNELMKKHNKQNCSREEMDSLRFQL
jgi:hypothetical protein